MENSKTRFLIPLALCAVLLIGASSASAQAVTYEIFSTPTFVINVGRAEVLGAIRIHPTNSAAASTATTVQILFNGVACDNDTTDGVFLIKGSAAGPGTGAFNIATVRVQSVSNTSAGCVVSIAVPSVAVGAGTTDFLELDGVRGRIDLSAASTAGSRITAQLSATPSGSALFNAPTTVDVAVSAVGRAILVVTGNQSFCGTLSPVPRVRVTEGFNGAFVQHVLTSQGTAIPVAARPNPAPLGGINNTQVSITVTNLPAGVTLTWPTFVNAQTPLTAAVAATTVSFPRAGGAAAAFSAGGALNDTTFPPGVGPNTPTSTPPVATGNDVSARLELIGTASSTSAVYEYASADQGVSDITTERFNIIPAVTLPTTLVIGSAQVAVQLAPLLVTNDATSITRNPFVATAGQLQSGETVFNAAKPRFNDTAVTGDIIAITPCTSNLLFPFVAGGAGFDTGIAIANTSKDPFTGGSSFLPTAPQTGTCTLTGWPAATGTPAVSFTTPSVAAGATFLTTLNDPANAAFNGFIGYIIARCNFQFGHGFAFITDNFGVGPPRIAHGYVALLIPDPLVYSGVFGTSTVPVGRAATICAGNVAAGVSQCIANLGEGLLQ